MKTLRLIPVILAALAALSACQNIPVDHDAKTPGQIDDDRLTGRDTGSLLTGRSQGGFSLGSLGGGGGGAALPVNALLWRASIDTLSVIPIASVDTFSGTIITDWYPHPETPTQSIKAAVFVIGTELRSDAVRAEIYVRRRNANGEWVDAGRDTSLATRLEDLILTRAREIRAGSVSESGG